MGMELAVSAVWTVHWVSSLGLIITLLIVEWLAPFRVPVQSKLEHVSTNLTIYGTNSLIAQVLAGSTLLLWTSKVTEEGWGLLSHVGLGPVASVIVSMILLDLIAYGIHRLYHQSPFLWRLHRAHHSDLDMDATTSIRFHLGEALITMGIKGLSVTGLGISPAGFFLSETVTFAVGLFSHGNLRLPSTLERRLRLAVVTPTMHWIHHSREPAEHNRNLGAVFSGWDRLFGTYFMGAPQSGIIFGLNEYASPKDVTLVRFYRMPFDASCRRIESHDYPK
jgi:sterol desaturase/sphingolipid hydroxylase (fatty acid hydroxylase superfamily)